MVYNMGTNDHPIGEIGVKVNDNAYHVIKFTRSGANSTIQIDDYNVQTNHPSGMLMYVSLISPIYYDFHIFVNCKTQFCATRLC